MLAWEEKQDALEALAWLVEAGADEAKHRSNRSCSRGAQTLGALTVYALPSRPQQCVDVLEIERLPDDGPYDVSFHGLFAENTTVAVR